MAAIGFTTHGGRQRASQIAKETAAWLESRGHVAELLPDVAPGPGLVHPPRPEGLEKLDLLVSLGGDGTMLRSVGLVVDLGVPVLGVNFGRFGYLTAAEPEGLQKAIERFLAGDYELQRRMTIDATVEPPAEGPDAAGGRRPRASFTALNDVVVARPSGMHTINTSVAISGKRFLRYAADSMIVSTPTGSTGYNLSARGPIVSPLLRCLVLTPVSPHMLFDRSLVLGAAEELSFRLEGRCEAELIVDGARSGQVDVGERLVCRAGRHDAVLVSFGERDFESVLKSKFHLADR